MIVTFWQELRPTSLKLYYNKSWGPFGLKLKENRLSFLDKKRINYIKLNQHE